MIDDAVGEPNGEMSAATFARESIAEWANANDEWIRWISSKILQSGASPTSEDLDHAYTLFRQEKGLDERELAAVGSIETAVGDQQQTDRLELRKLSNVRGVNALKTGATIEPHRGLTILFGENGAGKTGYARILKALADSRTAVEILGDVNEPDGSSGPSATIAYALGSEEHSAEWNGESGISPFGRMAIFDSPAVSTHLDDDLDYVITPAVLALFEHVIEAIKGVERRIEERINDLSTDSGDLLGHIPRGTEAYGLVETLGAATDLDQLRSLADFGEDRQERLESLRRSVAALEAGVDRSEREAAERNVRILEEAVEVADKLVSWPYDEYRQQLEKQDRFAHEYEVLRREAIGDIDAEAVDAWQSFVEKGLEYDKLRTEHSDDCPYCRQGLSAEARRLLNSYSSLIESELREELAGIDTWLDELSSSLSSLEVPQCRAFLDEYSDRGDQPGHYQALKRLVELRSVFIQYVTEGAAIAEQATDDIKQLTEALTSLLSTRREGLELLTESNNSRAKSIREAKSERDQLEAAVALAQQWSRIETVVAAEQEIDKLQRLASQLPKLRRGATTLSKEASDRLVNQSFDEYFAAECLALRAPELELAFIGRQGKAHRRKSMGLKSLQPSKVLSEGEQKVIALADFLAEARLAEAKAPVIFDDPVSSLDHRRLQEVAERIAKLAENTQVIVFTHDIFFTTTLLSLHDKSNRCAYYQVTDDDGEKGAVSKGTGPRWDTVRKIGGRINMLIQDAGAASGDTREALIAQAYSWIRSWCEVFTETELLAGVAVRFQPNVKMGNLKRIDVEALSESIPEISRVFEDACRFMVGHSQPLPTLSTRPSLDQLKSDWNSLSEIRSRVVS